MALYLVDGLQCQLLEMTCNDVRQSVTPIDMFSPREGAHIIAGLCSMYSCVKTRLWMHNSAWRTFYFVQGSISEAADAQSVCACGYHTAGRQSIVRAGEAGSGPQSAACPA
jgi:hypothetical protein